MVETRQHKQKFAFGPTRQLSDELGGQYLGNFHEASEFHNSHVQVDNSVNVSCRSLTIVRTVNSQNVFSHTNQIAQLGVNKESLPSTKGSGAPCTHPLKYVLRRDNKFSNLLCGHLYHLT